MGSNLKTPSDFVVCYTENGKLEGGTSLGIKIAMNYNIPIFNYGLKDTDKKFKDFLKVQYSL